ncbi:MAG: DUF3787 domain-containing protein [Bacillota bacterium]|nr:DUF3787 domain-containing protein [Bacillota bacterium]
MDINKEETFRRGPVFTTLPLSEEKTTEDVTHVNIPGEEAVAEAKEWVDAHQL